VTRQSAVDWPVTALLLTADTPWAGDGPVVVSARLWITLAAFAKDNVLRDIQAESRILIVAPQ